MTDSEKCLALFLLGVAMGLFFVATLCSATVVEVL